MNEEKVISAMVVSVTYEKTENRNQTKNLNKRAVT